MDRNWYGRFVDDCIHNDDPWSSRYFTSCDFAFLNKNRRTIFEFLNEQFAKERETEIKISSEEDIYKLLGGDE